MDTITSMLLKTVVSGKVNAPPLITHHFDLNDILRAYDTFEHAAREKALKVILTRK